MVLNNKSYVNNMLTSLGQGNGSVNRVEISEDMSENGKVYGSKF